MREQTRLVDRIATDLADVRWPDAAEIRGRGDRRRRRRTAVAAALAVIALAGVVAVWPAVGPPGGDLPTAATSAAAQLWIPPEALLQPEDVGPGLVALRASAGEDRSLAPLKRMDPALTCPAHADLAAYNGRVAYLRGNTLQSSPAMPGDPLTGEAVLHQVVVRMPGDLAGRLVGDVRGGIDRCARYETRGTVALVAGTVEAQTVHRWYALDGGFAGDDSVVFAHEYVASRLDGGGVLLAPAAYTMAMVRVGDLISFLQWEAPGTDPTEARRLTARAARWLCVAANPGC